MGGKNEKVAVFPAVDLDRFTGLPGFTCSGLDFKQFEQLLHSSVVFRERVEVEGDEDWKQLIPYTYIYHPGDDVVLGYQRMRTGGDPRLAGQWSIGFGGHINPADDRHSRARLLHVAINRELREELYIYGDYDEPRTVGFLYLDDTPVDRVHFGVVGKCVYSGELRDIAHLSEIAELKWIKREDLATYAFEGWSEAIVRSHLCPDSGSGTQNRGR